jgi:ketosteroid isomerase-like protein
MYPAFGRGDASVFLGPWRITSVVLRPPADALYKPRRGRDQVQEFFGQLAEAVEIQNFEPQEYIAQGDDVVVLGYESALVKASGRPYEQDRACVFTFGDGKVRRFRGYWDSASMAP